MQIWLPLLLSLMMVGGMVIGMKLKPSSPQTKIVIENDLASSKLGQGRIEELIRYIEAKYVDEVDSEKMVEKAIQSLIKDLDPHSSYLTAEQVIEVNEQLQGNFQGIGVEFMLIEDTIVVMKPIEGGPSEEVGILEGDRIVEISDTIVAGNEVEIYDVMRMLRGEENTKVKVGVLRDGEQEIRHFNIKRGQIPVHSVDIAKMIDEKTGYIKLNRFSATTYNEFMKGLEKLVEEHQMKDLIIDVRQNPGGYLQEATKILSQLFKEKNQLLVYTEGRAINRNDYESTGQNFFEVNNIVVLIDEGSASASEILAGAMQDLDRGTIIGRRSFGKGLVQEQYQLNDGSALRLTVARYYTPSGRSIQRPYANNDAYDDDFEARFKRGELVDVDKIEKVDSLVYETKNGRQVYGGGGITPDVFVSLDTLFFDNYYIELQNHIPVFCYKYYRNHKNSLNSYNLQSYLSDFEVSESLLGEFIDFTTTKDLARQSQKLFQLKDYIKQDIKARIAKHLFDDEGFYAVMQKEDKMIREALKIFNSPNQLVSKQKSSLKKDKEF